MNEQDIRQVVKAVLEAENENHAKNLDDVVLKAVATILTSFGINDQDRDALRADFVHLRKWRESVEQAQSITMKLVITTIVGGIVGAIWLGIKTILAVKS